MRELNLFVINSRLKSSDTLYTFDLPHNSEFVGFASRQGGSADFYWLAVYYRYNNCADWIDAFKVNLSSFNGFRS